MFLETELHVNEALMGRLSKQKCCLGTCDPLPSSIAPHLGGWEPAHWAVEDMEDQKGEVSRPGRPGLGGQACISPARYKSIRLSHSEGF